jgi:hypothetical protein
MAELVSCFECGKQISSAAEHCPHCATKFPHGRQCLACLKQSRASAGIETRDGQNPGWIDAGCYEDFKRDYQSIQYVCPVCKNIEACQTKIDDNNVMRPFFPACSRCGHPPDAQYYDRHCLHCRAYVIRIMASGTAQWPTHKKCEASRARLRRDRVVPKESGCLTLLALLLMASSLILALLATHY